MEKEQDTCQKLLAFAKDEFFEKGYKNASLRSICKKADMTTGAVYFFYGSKEALFEAVVEPFVTMIMGLLINHVEQDKSDIENNAHFDNHHDIEVGRAIAHAFYTDKDIAVILLEKSDGTKYSNFTDSIINMLEKEFYGYYKIADEEIDPWIVHWYAHLMVDSFVQTLLHFETEEDALPRLFSVTEILQRVWYKIFLKK